MILKKEREAAEQGPTRTNIPDVQTQNQLNSYSNPYGPTNPHNNYNQPMQNPYYSNRDSNLGNGPGSQTNNPQGSGIRFQ